VTTRIIAAVVGLLVLIPALWFGGTVAVDVIAVLALLVSVDEYARMAVPTDRLAAMGWIGAWVLVIGAGALVVGDAAALHLGVLSVVASMMFVAARPGPDLGVASDRLGRLVLGIMWLSLLIALPLLRRQPDGLSWLTLALVIPWLGDTGAYFAGRAFGKTPLHRRVSPKKTVEGMVGGLVATVAGVFVMRAMALPDLSPVTCVLLGTTLGCAGVLGDLAESLLKRSFDVKDSGWIMPGHGGLLDRIDSVLFVGPLLYVYTVYGGP
jgi:phosphatidate cytidylyltransferase